MPPLKGRNRIIRFLKLVYLKLFRINDTPQKIAIGVGLGIFFGVMPGMGPLAALLFAFILRVNRAGALIGSALTNTWLSIPVFLISIKAGSAVTGVNYKDIRDGWGALIKDFRLADLFGLPACKILFPVITGYLAVSLFIGISSYVIALIALKYIKKWH